MGLLDDAIREHLQLKLRHGADPAEVARLEDEALSPVPRDRASRMNPADEPLQERDETAAADAEPVLQPTAEYDVASAHAGDALPDKAAGNGKDPLQDPPEHDRLWFEQKPPGNFDF